MTLVVIGASYAGLQIAAAAREQGFAGPIRLIGDEPVGPYQRPPLSKGFLSGKTDEASLPLKAQAFYAEAGIELITGTRIASIERTAREVVAADGRRFAYDRLGLATGARPRLLDIPGADLDGVLPLRSLGHARVIRDRLAGVARAVVIGGGFIGLEIAAALRQLGREVTVLEAQGRLLARAVPETLSAFLADQHRAQGVRIELGTVIAAIEGHEGKVSGVRDRDGRLHPADLVIVGIGVLPNTELAVAAGLDCADGIVVDASMRTSDPLIVAAGDCTRHPNAFAEASIRLESVQNAGDQGRVAGATVAGIGAGYQAVPWFWSDQYDLKLQMAGLSQGHDRAVLRGAVADRRFSLYYFRGPDLIAVDSVNRPADHMLARKLVAGHAAVTPAAAADPAVDLKTFL